MSLRKNVASQHIGFCLNNVSTGVPVTAGGAGTVVIDGGAQAACAGTFTHKGTGQWDYAPTQAETNGNSISFAFTGTSAIQVGMMFFTIGYDPTVANLPANVMQINAITLAAQALAQSTQSICWGTCSGGTATTAVVGTLNNPAALTDAGQLIGRTIIFLGNTGTANQQSQASNITASTTGATPTITFTAMTHAPANGDVFVIL